MTGRKIIASMLATVLTLPLLSCFSERSTIIEPIGEGCEIPGSAIGPNQAVVLIRGFAFFPDTLRIEPGTRVTWVNCESDAIEPHTSTANAGSAGTWDSGLIAPGESFARTFPNAGTSGYFCVPHPTMIGAIIVQ